MNTLKLSALILFSAVLHVMPVALLSLLAITPHENVTPEALAFGILAFIASSFTLFALHTWNAKH
jgi:hypothetical protein